MNKSYSHTPQGKLVVCPTPLGNLGDMTKRSLEALNTCDIVCCEDTRVTGKLLSVFDIKKTLVRLDEASISHQALPILEKIDQGHVIAYCSDAGMPGVSDPGQRLISLAYEKGIAVEVLPGPTAVTTAYVASGFTATQFYFGGFFPRKSGEQESLLNSIGMLNSVLIFYESPLRLVASLKTIAQHFPFRRVAVCRELTKIHEEVIRDQSQKVYELFLLRSKNQPIKGECVIVIDAPGDAEKQAIHQDVRQHAKDLMQKLNEDRTLSNTDKVKLLKKKCHLSRNEAYELVHSFKNVN